MCTIMRNIVCELCETYAFTVFGGHAIIIRVTPQYIISFLLYPIGRNTFSEKDSSPQVLSFLLP